MTAAPPDWWRKPRRISVVVDNPSWILPHAERLVALANDGGDDASLCRTHDEVTSGEIAFYLGCVKITPPEVLARNRRNIVVHESALPEGRGFAPVAWQILDGKNDIPICLIEATEETDAGPVLLRDQLSFEGHELNSELRKAQGEMSIALCLRFLDLSIPHEGEPQAGEATTYPRRKPGDSRLDPERSIADQFDLLRVVDNERYPAFFDLRGHRYRLRIDKSPEDA